MLNELDKELEARGLRFTRYADDCVIAVKSESSAKRVMGTVSDWIQRKLGLKVNMTKTHITRPMKAKVSRFWVLQRQQDEGMEVQTPSGICEEVQRQIERIDL